VLNLAAMTSDAEHVPGLIELLTFEQTIDLFNPPQREEIRLRAVELTARRMKQRDIAQELKVTQTAVQNALALDRKMKELGLSSPYVVMTHPPEDYPKLRRHKNPKFCFELSPGYSPTPLT